MKKDSLKENNMSNNQENFDATKGEESKADATASGESVSEKAKRATKDAGQAVSEAAKTVASRAREGIMAFGNSVANKSKEIMEVVKLNNQKAQKQKEMDATYRKLGEMAYAKGRLRGEMAEVAKQIKDLYSELQQIEVAINCALSTKECKGCGNMCHVNDNYCSNCGKKF